MQRFMSSGASSSSSRVERPLSIPGGTSSAEKPAPSLRIAEQFATPAYVKILTIHDVQRWLAEESIASCTDESLQRIREAAAALSRPKPKQQEVQPIQNKWQIAQKKNGKRVPLEDVVHEFQGKVVEAAQKLQVEFANNAEKLVASVMDTADAVDSNDEPWLAELKARHKKRAQDSAAEEQMELQQKRPHAKPKVASKQKKRFAGEQSEQSDSKKQARCLTSELFAANAKNPSEFGAANTSNAVKLAPVQQQNKDMNRLLYELNKLLKDGWAVGDEKDALKEITSQATDLQHIPATRQILRKPAIKKLYDSFAVVLIHMAWSKIVLI